MASAAVASRSSGSTSVSAPSSQRWATNRRGPEPIARLFSGDVNRALIQEQWMLRLATALALLSNCVVAWNTLQLRRIVARLEESDRRTEVTSESGSG